MRPKAPVGAASSAYVQAYELHRAGRLRDALDICVRALSNAPPDAPTIVLLARILGDSGHWNEAREALGRALAVDAANAEAWLALADAEAHLGRSEASLAALDKVLSFNALNAEIHGISASIALAAGDPSRAVALATVATRLDPSLPVGWVNLALALQRQRQHEGALAAARRAATLDRHDAVAVGLVAQLEAETGDLHGARATIDAARARHPRHAGLIAQSASIATRAHDLAAAIDDYQQLLALNPDDGASLSQLVFARKETLAWQGLRELQSRFRAGVAAQRPHLTPFSFLSDPSTRAEQRLCAETWSQGFVAPVAPKRTWPDARRRMRVGYLSSDFQQHPTAVLVAGVLEAHDRDRVEVFAYSSGPDDGSALRRRVAAATEHFADLHAQDPDQAAARIRADALDVLIDLKGHTDGAPTRVLALRPAPIQAHWVGYPGTLGAPFVDYLFADRVVVPPEHAADYSEALVWLPHAYQPNDRRRVAGDVPTRASLGLAEHAVVLAGFNATWKYNAAVFDAWARVLAAVPDAVLWLLARSADDAVIAQARRELASRGVPAARVVFSARRAEADYLALYGHADLLLDTWPYNAHTTAADALWMQCPVVTWLGDTFAGRVGASLATAAGVPELIAADVDGYVALAIELAHDAARRRALRARLAEARAASPLFDAAAMARHVEHACATMMTQAREGRRASFGVPAAG